MVNKPQKHPTQRTHSLLVSLYGLLYCSWTALNPTRRHSTLMRYALLFIIHEYLPIPSCIHASSIDWFLIGLAWYTNAVLQSYHSHYIGILLTTHVHLALRQHAALKGFDGAITLTLRLTSSSPHQTPLSFYTPLHQVMAVLEPCIEQWLLYEAVKATRGHLAFFNIMGKVS